MKSQEQKDQRKAGRVLKAVALEKIAPSDYQTRGVKKDGAAKGTSEASVKDLIDSIAKFGLLNPLIVRPTSKAGFDYELIAGHRRHQALLALAKGDPRFSVVDVIQVEMDDNEAQAAVLVDNVVRKNLSLVEKVAALDSLKSIYGTWEQVAKALAWSQDKIFHLKQLEALPREVFESTRLNESQKWAILKHGRDDAHRIRLAEFVAAWGIPARSVGHIVENEEGREAEIAQLVDEGKSLEDATQMVFEKTARRRVEKDRGQEQAARAKSALARFAHLELSLDAWAKESEPTVVMNELTKLQKKIDAILEPLQDMLAA